MWESDKSETLVFYRDCNLLHPEYETEIIFTAQYYSEFDVGVFDTLYSGEICARRYVLDASAKMDYDEV
jgi:hypothetical protein